jgi:hypothetical protein
MGHNAGSLAWDGSSAPASMQTIGRTWRIAETGDVGTVTISIDTRDTDADMPSVASLNGRLYVVVDDDAGASPDFSDETVLGNTVKRLWDDGTNGDTTSGDGVYSVSGVEVGDNQYISFAQDTPPTPGAVSSGIKLWLKADNAVFTDTASSTAPADAGVVNRWHDLSGNNRIFSAGTTPNYRSATNAEAINFNPVVDFVGGQSDTMNYFGSIPGVTAAHNDLHYYSVVVTDSFSNENDQLVMPGMSSGSGYFAFRTSQGNANHYLSATSNQAVSYTNSNSVTGYPYLWHTYNKTTGADEMGVKRNNKTILTYPVASSMTSNNVTNYLF